LTHPRHTQSMADCSRLFRDPNEIILREELIFTPHVAPLNNWVLDLRKRLGPEAIVPWFDPWDGGIGAKILWLLEAPGPKATKERGGSGFVSCNNNDGTAENTWETRNEAGVKRDLVVHWNVIPYYLGNDQQILPPDPTDIEAVGPLIAELLDLLPNLQVVILGGNAAKRVWRRHGPKTTGLHVIESRHTSPRSLNTRPAYRDKIVEAWTQALQHVNQSDRDQ